MKYLLFLIPFLLQAQSWWWMMGNDGVSYEAETLAYQARVEADGGEVISISDVNKFYKDAKANDYLDTLHVALLYTGGIKRSNDSIYVWYDLTSNNNDFNTVGLSQQYVPLYSLTSGIGSSGTPQLGCVLTYSQPTSYYSIIKRPNAQTGYFWGSIGDQALLQTTPALYLYAGASFVSAINTGNNIFELYRIVYNGAASSAQINNGAVGTGNPGTQGLSSTSFAILKTVKDTYFKCFVITKMLSATKDLALKNILNTIYPTY